MQELFRWIFTHADTYGSMVFLKRVRYNGLLMTFRDSTKGTPLLGIIRYPIDGQFQYVWANENCQLDPLAVLHRAQESIPYDRPEPTVDTRFIEETMTCLEGDKIPLSFLLQRYKIIKHYAQKINGVNTYPVIEKAAKDLGKLITDLYGRDIVQMPVVVSKEAA
ncbi:MAG: hypothetical protein AAFU67_01695 [Bacteroidota bacterium]